MKIFSQIRYVLFAIMVVGAFANFAQDEYGLTIYYHSCFVAGLTFVIESFIYLNQNFKTNKLLAFYLFTESFFLGVLFIGFDAKNMHWNYTVILIFSGIISIFILYLVGAIRILFKEFKYGKRMAIAMFFVMINTVAAIAFYVFKTMHWTGTMSLVITSFSITMVQLVIIIFRVKYFYKGKQITLRSRMMQLPGRLPTVYCYFTVWVVHFSLFIWGIVPGFYLLRIPPAMQKMNETGSPKSEIYGTNYETFIQNRINAEESK